VGAGIWNLEFYKDCAMKKLSLFVLMCFATISLMAQLQRSLPSGVQTQADPQGITQNETPAKERGTVTQNFEAYTDFTLSFSPWTTKDIEGSTTFGIEGFSFLHSGEAMSFIVFNPGSTTPSLLDDPAILPHGGMKYAACFASTTHPNNDWIISPLIELGANGHLKFWVKSYTSNYGLERYKVGVSTTTPEPASFTIISVGNYLEAPAEAWTLKDFDLSAYAGMDIHIGIQCVSDNAFIFMVDDIEITSDPAGIHDAPWGKEVSIYPNPAKDQLHVSADFPVRSIRLVDMNGMQIIRMEDCGMNCTLDLKKMADGIYIIQVETEKGIIHRKVSVRN